MTPRVILLMSVLIVAGCHAPVTTGPAASPEPPVASATAPSVQAAVLGATLTISDGGATAAYTVGSLRPVPVEAQIIPAKGTMYAVDVIIAAQTGTVTYNGFYFVARAQDGSTIAPAVGAVKPGITSGELGQGQSVEGHVAFDVSAGQSVAQVALRDPQGKTLAVWGAG